MTYFAIISSFQFQLSSIALEKIRGKQFCNVTQNVENDELTLENSFLRLYHSLRSPNKYFFRFQRYSIAAYCSSGKCHRMYEEDSQFLRLSFHRPTLIGDICCLLFKVEKNPM